MPHAVVYIRADDGLEELDVTAGRLTEQVPTAAAARARSRQLAEAWLREAGYDLAFAREYPADVVPDEPC